MRIVDGWKTLAQANFDTVDAVLPAHGFKNEAYVFSGNQYVHIWFGGDTSEERIIDGPRKIAAGWKTLEEAHFDTIDAAIPVPFTQDEVYFFSGSQYVRVKYRPNSAEEKITSGPTRIAGAWKCLAWGW